MQTAAELTDFCLDQNISIIFYDNWGNGSLDVGSGRQDVFPNDAVLAQIISAAHAKGLLVRALYTDNTAFGHALAYNSSHHRTEQFDGIHMDYEPSAEPSDSCGIGYYQASKTRAGDLPLSVSISHHWNTTVVYGGQTKPAYQHVLDIVDGADVQTAQDCAATIVSISTDEVCYANALGKPVLITLETYDVVQYIPGMHEWNTYFEEGESGDPTAPCTQRGMKDDLHNIGYPACLAGASGFAFHFYKNSYGKGTPGWSTHPPTSVVPGSWVVIEGG
jgi:hypothetical protein